MKRIGLFSDENRFKMNLAQSEANTLAGAQAQDDDQGHDDDHSHDHDDGHQHGDTFIFAFERMSVVFGDGLVAAALTPNAFGRVFSYTSGSDAIDNSEEFNITVGFFGEEGAWTEELIEDFIAAADTLSTIITGDLPDWVTRRGFTLVDDLYIRSTLEDIDGEGGVLGQAGPTFLRSDTSLPFAGIMEFDLADAEQLDADGLWDEVILHEMTHVLGFGTLWETLGLVETTSDDNGTPFWPFDDVVTDIRYIGEGANEVFETEFPENFDLSDGLGIQVETDGGPGTAGGHWDEVLFDAELMTGYINESGNYLSEMTIASLEDLGYETIWESGAVA